MRGVFLDISKAFDTVWHEGLLLRIIFKWYPRKPSKTFTCFSIFLQTTSSSKWNSSWENANVWVPQGSILGPLLL